jgi:hypothetical protein
LILCKNISKSHTYSPNFSQTIIPQCFEEFDGGDDVKENGKLNRSPETILSFDTRKYKKVTGW